MPDEQSTVCESVPDGLTQVTAGRLVDAEALGILFIDLDSLVS